MQPQKPRICIVIVSYNHHHCLEPCLHSLQSELSPEDTAIIIENHPHCSDSIHHLSNRFSQFHWIFNKNNLGFTGGNHQGIQWALSEGFHYIFLLNPDTELSKGALQELVSVSESKHNRWILSPILLQPDIKQDPTIDSAGLFLDRFFRARDRYRNQPLSTISTDNPDSILHEVKGLCGAALFIPASLFPIRENSAHDVFDDSFFAYFEDMEFSLYWIKKGNHMGVAPNAKVIHHRGGGSKLERITVEAWKANRVVIEKMILNRYITLTRHISRKELFKRLPLFMGYETFRWVYIAFRKPFLLTLLAPSLKMVFNKLIFGRRC